ncbi:MAG: hypothetical protein ABIN48_05575 [Ginsengibacter sp.]
MDGATTYLVMLILSTMLILAGLGIVIYGMVKKKVKLIALGVFVAMLPTLVSWFSSKLL